MKTNYYYTRRKFLSGSAVLSGTIITGCTSAPKFDYFGEYFKKRKANKGAEDTANKTFVTRYGAMPNERFPVPAVNLKKVPAKYYRRQVNYPTTENVGTVIVDTRKFYLYLVQEGGKAMRYGVGLGRAGFEWSGRARVGWKQEWPKWTPPQEMIERQPELAKYSEANGGMPPGLNNPLGARALYIFQGKEDTLYRIHGTPEYWTIGKAVSSGCVRMMNQDVIDLYGRVTTGSEIIVT